MWIWPVESASAFRGMFRSIREGEGEWTYAIQHVLTLLEAKHDDIAVAICFDYFLSTLALCQREDLLRS